MQLRKPLVERTRVKPEAIELALKIAEDRWEKLKETLEVYGDLYGQDKRLAVKIRPLIKKDHLAIEQLKADLGGMPYEEIGATQHGEKLYIYGRTKPIEAKLSGGAHGYGNVKAIDLGIYKVVLDETAFVNFSLNNCHLIPEREPCTQDRHYHHTAYSRDYSPIQHPLDTKPSWCTASFSSIFTTLFGELDFAGVFKIMHRFLSVFDTHSPLRTNLPHEIRILK